jgi:hypothetical protein
MARPRTPRWIAHGHRREYHREPHGFRGWRQGLTWGCFGVSLAWLGLLAVGGSERIYSSGPIALAHRFIESDCSKCHVPFGGTPDDRCVACHPDQAAKHDERQIDTPGCASCHVEHDASRSDLTRVADGHCTRCHADVERSDGSAPAIERSVSDFQRNHPDFGAFEPRVVDPVALRFNHEKHLAALDLKLPQEIAREMPLRCESCHVPDASGRHFEPIAYERTCRRCHDLGFDAEFPQWKAPHADPGSVRDFLRARYGEVAAAGDRLDGRVASAERVLFAGKCQQCHAMEAPAEPAAVPSVKPVFEATPMRWLSRSATNGWLSRARFDHAAHRPVRCQACHAEAWTSRDASDVLLPRSGDPGEKQPGIATCRSCHQQDGGARADCAGCHVYHRDRSTRAPFGGRLGLGFEILPPLPSLTDGTDE